ncbi:O-antigen ligase family protein [Paramicrobacterium chengjingii]|uniref:O-antigen ligase family protein n=1 Tax=Paramicrobacterium chengjingii TaxID=2769067 RepID=A0ABX6YKS4_9MICO|nr:O-antigen ligase family protein [Microbacterium chengjingii]QPZ39416.1 O-antigen ligase family protein [Microbacterium chengjingii]
MSSPVVAPPATLSTRQRVIAAHGTFGLFVAFGGEGVRNLAGWPAYVTIVSAYTLATLVVLAMARPKVSRRELPKALIAYLVLALVSVAWSNYQGATLLTYLGTFMCTVVGLYVALMFTWQQVLTRLANALKWIIGLSLAFELWVSLFIRDMVLPLSGGVYVGEEPPLLAYWSRNLLFEGGKIQGILGNSNLLSICALFAIIVVGIQLAIGSVRGRWGWLWMALSIAAFLLTRSSTIIVAAIIAALALLAVVIARRASARGRTTLYASAAVIVAGVIASVLLFTDQLLAILGKSEDLTGRTEFWSRVIHRASERPWFGWGYSSPWIPGQLPLDDPLIRHDVVQLHAHNAWLDVWLQLGILGVVIFAAIVASLLWRSWFTAIDRPRFDLRTDRPYSALSLLPLLIAVVLLVQSLAESRILIESGWVLVVLLVLKTKQERTIIEDEAP